MQAQTTVGGLWITLGEIPEKLSKINAPGIRAGMAKYLESKSSSVTRH
jgi:hypothetical protein